MSLVSIPMPENLEQVLKAVLAVRSTLASLAGWEGIHTLLYPPLRIKLPAILLELPWRDLHGGPRSDTWGQPL